MATKTLEQLLKERTALDLAFAGIEFGPVSEILASLQANGTKDLRDKAVTFRDKMPDGEAKTQMNNIVIVLDGVTNFFVSYLDSLNARLAPPAPVGGEDPVV